MKVITDKYCKQKMSSYKNNISFSVYNLLLNSNNKNHAHTKNKRKTRINVVQLQIMKI